MRTTSKAVQERTSRQGAADLEAVDSRASVVEARALRKHYKGLEAVKGINFTVRSGEFFGMLGPNGAGKSTTMRMIYRVTPITSGSLTVLGMAAGRRDRDIKAQLGVVPQLDNLDEELSVRENLLIYARYNDIPRALARRRADELLEFLELDSKRNALVDELSGGMKRRLTLARGLMNDPQLVILDEPTTGLDPQVRLTLWQKLEELRARGVTLFMSTHYMDEAERLCDRLVIMNQGEIISQGTPRALVREHARAEVVEARLEPHQLDPLMRVSRELGGQLEQTSDRVSLYVSDGHAALARLEQGGVVMPGAFVRPGNLEDVFLKLTGRVLRE